jgi:diguanylate cyclase (GGDEF)-like protein
VTREERIFLRARVVLCVILAAGIALNIPLPKHPNVVMLYLSLLTLLLAGTIVAYLAARSGPRAVSRAMTWLLLPDLIVIVGFTYLFHDAEDAFYPVAILLAVSYALVSKRKDLWVVAALISGAYMAGHLAEHPLDWSSYAVLVFKTLAIPAIGAIVVRSLVYQRERQQDAMKTAADEKSAKVLLQSRLRELQAVARITDTVHSSLDLDEVGPQLLEILGDVLGIETCSLMVIDKSNSQTVFSASRGPESPSTSKAGASGDQDHLACRSVCDHGGAMVLFCAEQAEMDGLSAADELVLSAIANQLVVAVENARLYELTRLLAITDELTGLYNYRELQSRLDQEIDRAVRYGSVLSLLMIDADDFKLFNDVNGHIAGDVALSEIGTAMLSVVREVDLVARYGGEEFAVMLPETDAAGAFVVAEKIRDAISRHRFRDELGEECAPLTVSVGVASFPAYAADKAELLREADRALYDAKRRGKNRVCTPQPRTIDPAAEPNGD